MCDECGCGQPSQPSPAVDGRRLILQRDLRQVHAEDAAHNRAHLAARGAVAVNLVSSPGAGKTTLLEATLRALGGRPVAVIEGDQQTDRDAQRIAATGAPVVQINTGAGCHLDAAQVHDALHRLDVPDGALVLIENVGNLICPAGFDLGQTADVTLLSVTEGEDKPAKYPDAFRTASAMVLTKVDLLPHLEFDVERCLADARALHPDLPVFQLSAKTGAGMDAWLGWLAGLAPPSVD